MKTTMMPRLLPHPLVYHRTGPIQLSSALTQLDAVLLSVRGLGAAGLITGRLLRSAFAH